MHGKGSVNVKKIGVVLVNWNGGEFTVPCIESLKNGTVQPDHILVVDNASSDGSPDLIAKRFSDVELVRNSQNLGFTGANNTGIKRLMDAGCGYVWILNNDTLANRNCLQELKEHMDAHPGAGACTGKILYAEPPDRIWYGGAIYNPWAVRTRHKGIGERDRGQFDAVTEVPFLSGCCMFVRRSALERIGMFNDRFFAYAEDNDWCLRARKNGIRLVYVPTAVLRHRVAASFRKVKDRKTKGSTSPFSVYITSRNSLYLIRMHAEGAVRWCSAMLAFLLRSVVYGIVLLILGRSGKFRALAMSLWDGLRLPTGFLEQGAPKPRYLR